MRYLLFRVIFFFFSSLGHFVRMIYLYIAECMLLKLRCRFHASVDVHTGIGHLTKRLEFFQSLLSHSKLHRAYRHTITIYFILIHTVSNCVWHLVRSTRWDLAIANEWNFDFMLWVFGFISVQRSIDRQRIFGCVESVNSRCGWCNECIWDQFVDSNVCKSKRHASAAIRAPRMDQGRRKSFPPTFFFTWNNKIAVADCRHEFCSPHAKAPTNKSKRNQIVDKSRVWWTHSKRIKHAASHMGLNVRAVHVIFSLLIIYF